MTLISSLSFWAAVLAVPIRSISVPSSNIRWIDCTKNVPQSSQYFNTSAINLSNLPSTLHCGQIDVPMDYSKPFCETNMITVALGMYRPTKPKGALFHNPGGTDAGVILAWEIALNYTNAFNELLDFDILVMDVRGTYSSNLLNVSLDVVAGVLGPYPTNQTAYDTIKAASATAVKSWVELSSPPGIIEHVGTREVVQDYEMIRRALGYEKISFLGASYGSFRAAQYAATYPERVDNFVLDAVVPHGRSMFDQVQDTMAATNRLMLRADAYCQNNSSCPFHNQGKGSVPKAFKQVVQIADATPFFFPPCVNTTICYPYSNGFNVRTVLYGNTAIPDFPAILDGIYAALHGDGSFFIDGPAGLEDVLAMPVLCNDYTFQKSLQAGLEVLKLADVKSDQTGIGLSQIYQIQLFCSAWPFQTPKSEPLNLDQKMLLVTADFENQAATEWSTFTWSQARNSTLVVRHGDDHVSFPLVDQPSTKITMDFLNSGTLPAAVESELVSVYTPGMTRKPISDPYQVPTGAIAGDVDSGNVTVEIPF
ncbi:hypothetical protein L207DRAFT_441349 [Hyaloscypha variabilis F]|uniref:Alpha/beta-hydrolase n=1 Tax=Hyaloscypha variabilis (strain UAMH 11265 / GT02V1 / F) TaxID=1149755 RepID=A0A2J6R0F4_HYAVF|nr:hypothetical protein L207DRAFT_441349 [Hyaloscypha variabilis F]